MTRPWPDSRTDELMRLHAEMGEALETAARYGLTAVEMEDLILALRRFGELVPAPTSGAV